MGMDIGKRGGVRAEINVTPLVDIVLVLLIIFIVITPAVSDAVQLPLAKHSPKPPDPKSLLTLVLQGGNDERPGPVTLEGTEHRGMSYDLASDADRTRLEDLVRRSTSRLLDKRVFVKADRTIPFWQVHGLFKLCREGGADEVSIVTGEEPNATQGGAS
jgi:biopolymer transport protein ExbD/biopolymer transport protein TolR